MERLLTLRVSKKLNLSNKIREQKAPITLSHIARKCGAKNPQITAATKTGKPRTKSAAMWVCDIAEGKEKIEGLSY